jgi:hypothetical protein
MSASVDIQELLAGIQRMGAAQMNAARGAAVEFAAHVAGDSAELAPVDEGHLKASATWGELQYSSDGFYVLVGHNVDYAAAVHERLDVHHDQGQAKFLETSVRNNTPKFAPFVADRMKGAIGG